VLEDLRTQNERHIDKLYAATQPGAVFSPPVVAGDHTVITASEVVAAGGFGFGQTTTGEGGAGGGGGGGSTARPVAAISIGPDGVKVQPIVDATKIALAGITAWASIVFMLVRMWRASVKTSRR
jgi:uncharacterized spore protein YtfJ